MTISDPAGPPSRSFAGELLYAIRYYLGGRVGLVAIAAAALGLGAYYNWAWLVAAGIAPILLTALPCAAMCALGLCMGGRSQKNSEPESAHDLPADTGQRLLPGPGAPLSDDSSDVTAPEKSPRTKAGGRKGCC